MEIPHAFVFVQHQEQVAIGRAIQAINKKRRQLPGYKTLLLTSERRGWIALLLGNGVIDPLLMRNLSGQLHTTTFEIAISMLAFSYRLHQEGRTVDAFESNLVFYAQNRLQRLQKLNDPGILDLVEPVERFVLERFQAMQRPGAVDPGPLDIPDILQASYQGDPACLGPVLHKDADAAYITRLLAPGYNPEVAFERLVDLLDLPYLPSDHVEVEAQGMSKRVTGYDLTRPATWREGLPPGWRRMNAKPREST